VSLTAWHIRQFSCSIRPGAVRVALTGGSAAVGGVAFMPKGKELPVVVLLNATDEARALDIDGLPPGEYGVTFTSRPADAYGRKMPDVRVGEPGRVALDLPPRSVTTLAAAAD
jgi:hypothetical protein